MLVVMHHRNVEFLNKAALYFKTIGSRNIFEVYATKIWSNGFHDADYFFWIMSLCIKHQGPRVNACHLAEDKRLAFHHRESAVWANVAEAEHRRAIRDNGDG